MMSVGLSLDINTAECRVTETVINLFVWCWQPFLVVWHCPRPLLQACLAFETPFIMYVEKLYVSPFNRPLGRNKLGKKHIQLCNFKITAWAYASKTWAVNYQKFVKRCAVKSCLRCFAEWYSIDLATTPKLIGCYYRTCIGHAVVEFTINFNSRSDVWEQCHGHGDDASMIIQNASYVLVFCKASFIF